MSQTALVAYYLVCTILAFVTYKAMPSPTLRWTVLAAGVSFAALAIGNSVWRSIGGLAFLAFIASGILFMRAITQHQNLSTIEKGLFILMVVMIMMRSLFRVLSLSGTMEMSMVCLVTIVITGVYVLYAKYKVAGLRGKMDVVEVAGLFTCFALPMLIPLVQLLMTKL